MFLEKKNPRMKLEGKEPGNLERKMSGDGQETLKEMRGRKTRKEMTGSIKVTKKKKKKKGVERQKFTSYLVNLLFEEDSKLLGRA